MQRRRGFVTACGGVTYLLLPGAAGGVSDPGGQAGFELAERGSPVLFGAAGAQENRNAEARRVRDNLRVCYVPLADY
jgi:hypothetical protein